MNGYFRLEIRPHPHLTKQPAVAFPSVLAWKPLATGVHHASPSEWLYAAYRSHRHTRLNSLAINGRLAAIELYLTFCGDDNGQNYL